MWDFKMFPEFLRDNGFSEKKVEGSRDSKKNRNSKKGSIGRRVIKGSRRNTDGNQKTAEHEEAKISPRLSFRDEKCSR